MYYKSPELGEQEHDSHRNSVYKYPEMTSIVSHELSLRESKRHLGLDLISLPDQKDYRGSWRILFKLKKDDLFEDKINIEEPNSLRHINRKKLPEFLDEIENPRPVTSNRVIKIIATHSNDTGSHASWLYSDSSASQTMKLNIMDDKGNTKPILNEQQIEFYKELYDDIIKFERGEKELVDNHFPLDFNPKEAMVMLNESFKIGESMVENDPSIENSNMLAVGRNSVLGDMSLFPKTTLRGYTRKLTKQPTLFSRGSVNDRKSLIPSDQKKDSIFKSMEGSKNLMKNQKPEEGRSTKNNSTKMNKSMDFSLSGDSQDVLPLESEDEDQNQVKVVINLSREIWMSLRMAPVLSYAPQIKENIEALGFKIKFIEDLVVMNEEYKELVQKKIQEINDKSINNVRLSRFNKMGLKKLKTMDHRNLPQDQREFKDTSQSNNTMSIDKRIDPLEMMNHFEGSSPGESLRIVSYYHVNNSKKSGCDSIYYKDCSSKHHNRHRHSSIKKTVRGKVNKPVRLCR